MGLFSRVNYEGGPWQGYGRAKQSSTEDEKRRALLSIAQARYEESIQYPIDGFFGVDFKHLLAGKDLLEIGSNHGGAAFYYYSTFKVKSLTGIDTTDSQAEISNLFFRNMGATSNYLFQKAFAEALPFASESFDAILSFDVIEHVQDVPKTLSECHRVLRPGGKAFLAFPSYYHPVGHHLNAVTVAPCIHWFYSSKTLMAVYYDILDANPEYRDKQGETRKELRPWEKLCGINGVTLTRFREYIKQQPWKSSIHVPLPLGAGSHLINQYPFLKPLTSIFAVGTRLPILWEFCNHRIAYILCK